MPDRTELPDSGAHEVAVSPTCVCGVLVYLWVSVGSHGNKKRTLDSQSWSYRWSLAVWCGSWKLNAGPLTVQVLNS